MQKITVLLLFSCIIAVTSCSTRKNTSNPSSSISPNEAEEIRKSLVFIETTDPEEEAVRNFNNGNWLFKGYYSNGLVVPGDENGIAGRGSVDIIKGTQAGNINQEHARLMNLVPNYCSRYNQKMRQLLKPTWHHK